MSAFAALPAQDAAETVVRFHYSQSDNDFLAGLAMDPLHTSEMKALLVSRGAVRSLHDLVDAPFKPKRRLSKSGYSVSRYSDGSFPVAYFSLEAETAQAEVRHRFFARFAGRPTSPRTAWYSRFSCSFEGRVKDVRPMEAASPELTDDAGYAFCNCLGAEAVSAGLDGLLAPSARRSGGTNVPVFERRALSNPREHSLVPITYPGSGVPTAS